MCQQTGVATVVPYYEKFLARFPTLESLATSEEKGVMQAWQGLGYYRRAKNLRNGAKLILKEFAGKIPDTPQEILQVPGIGKYTGGAILAIAFRKPSPALDGNLIRVYSRFYGLQDDIKKPQTLKKLWRIALEHTPEKPEILREFTEGMMELGAIICKPRNPDCSRCPIRWGCQAFELGNSNSFPVSSPSAPRKKYMEAVVVRQDNNRIAFLPTGSDSKFPDFLRLPFRQLSTEPLMEKVLKELKYSVTNRDFKVFVMKSGFGLSSKNWIWMKSSRVDELLLPAIDRKILKIYGIGELKNER